MSSFDSPAACGDRQCGACTACCVQLPVPDGILGPWGKPAGVPCRHVGPLGCRCYDRRPSMCVEFHCAWLSDSAWPPPWRPDRSGLLCLREMLEDNRPGALVYEMRPGALQSPVAAEILAEIRRTAVVLTTVDANQQHLRYAGEYAGGAEVRRMAS